MRNVRPPGVSDDAYDFLPARPPTPPRDDGGGPADLAGWLRASLLGIGLGFWLARSSRLWAGQVTHPGVVWGVGLILLSASLTLLAARRHVREVARRAPDEAVLELPRTMAVLSVLLVLGTAWAAVALVLSGRG